jgi:hypothetical protein
MKYPLRTYLLIANCLLFLTFESSAQLSPAQPRCCYPIISEVNNKIGFIDETGRVVEPAGRTECRGLAACEEVSI